MSDPEILFHQNANAGVVTLNRPQALNAVTHSMVLQLYAQLREWEHDPAIRHIIIKAAAGRAFSAGGDIRDLYQRGIAGKPHLQFFWDEYRLNAYIKEYPKPYIALIDGIVMGGGVGVSFHGSHRIAGDNISFAMPEVGIGFFPDVGGSYFLPRLPGNTGLYLALTGNRIKKDDLLWCGLATDACASEDLEELEQALCDSDDVDAVLTALVASDGETELSRRQKDIDAVFGADSLAEIMQNLHNMAGLNDGDQSQWAQKVFSTIKSKSPKSLAITFHQLCRGRQLDMRKCMQLEYRIVSRILSDTEFYEGIRAAIIDKDNAPQWHPKSIDAIDQTAIAAIFAPLDGTSGTLDGELVFE